VVYEHTDATYQYTNSCFKTKNVFFEFYIGIDQEWVDTNPQSNPMIQSIRGEEQQGRNVEHILIAREAECVGHGWRGPIPEDSRILFQRDINEHRELIQRARDLGIIHGNPKLIQMVREANVFWENPQAWQLVSQLDGVAYEMHHFGEHWPLETGKTDLYKLAVGSIKITDMGKDYIQYFGPWKWVECEDYYHDAVRHWYQRMWESGLRKCNDHMHYYLNAFPFGCGRRRRVGGEQDDSSIMGELKWLIEQVKFGC
jgi:hypothetical protein